MTFDYAAAERFAVIDLGDGSFTHAPEPQIAGTLLVNKGSRVVRRDLTESLAQRIAARMGLGGLGSLGRKGARMKVHYKVHRDGSRGVFFAVDVSVLDVLNPGDQEAIVRACARDFGLPEDWNTPAVFSLHAKENGPEIARFTVTAARPETIYSAERIS